MDDLGSKRPMDLLNEMVELVTPGEEKTKLFACCSCTTYPLRCVSSSMKTTTPTCAP